MKKNLKSAFSLAELMIVLLVLSIILSAVMPVVTKRSSAAEQIWRWCQNTAASAHFGEGQNQSLLVGVADMPASDGSAITDFNYTDTNMVTSGDKLILFKKRPDEHHPMSNSHITFFTADANGSDPHYVGRLAMEQTNIALGKFALGNIQTPDYADASKMEIKNNLAIGQEALKFTYNGHSNIAIGNGTLAKGQSIAGNTAVGYNALTNTTSNYNTAYGLQAGMNNTTGTANTVIGVQALKTPQKADANTVIGYLALSLATQTENSNLNNVFIGSEAGYNTSKSNTKTNNNNNNVVVGHRAGQNAGNADISANFNNNVIIGKDAGINVGTAGSSNNNIIMGFQAGLNSTTTNNNIYVGTSAGYVSSGGNNVFLGSNSGYDTTGSENVFIGSDAGYTNTVTDNNQGMYNVFIGQKSGAGNLEGQYNVFLGQNSGTANTNGINNTFVGASAGLANTTGENNVYIGYRAGASASATASHKLEISSNNSPLIKGDFGDIATSTPSSLELLTENFKVGKSSQQIQILTTSGKLDFKTDNIAFGETTSANISMGASGIEVDQTLSISSSKNFYTHGQEIVNLIQSYAGSMSSDRRLKNIQGEATEGLSAIDALKVVKFTYKQDEKKQEHIGVIAQDVQKVIPSAVLTNEQGFLSVKFTDILYSAVKALQELHQAVIELANNIKSLEVKITANSDKIKKLEKENKELKQELKTLEDRMKKAGI